MHRIRRRYRRVNGRFVASAVAAGLLLAAAHGHVPPVSGQTASVVQPGAADRPRPPRRRSLMPAPSSASPTCTARTGPDAFDCSGLVMMAYQAAGVSIPRTSEDQWADLPHVSSPQPGDLVFFPGSDGTWAAPGHVALVISATADDPGVRHRCPDRGFPAQR